MDVTRYTYLHPRPKVTKWLAQRKVLTSEQERQMYDARFPRPPPTEMEPMCLAQVYNDPHSEIKWAPRDALDVPCDSLRQWREQGYHAYQLVLSLIGSDDARVRAQNRFVKSGYTYVHMSFDRLVEALRRLHPDDRLFCYLIPTAAPVHLYLDLDGDVKKFPHLPGREEEMLNELLVEMAALFADLFHRPMDASGLLLLEATSPVKVSWHVHIRSEAFRSVEHLKAFVMQLKQRVLRKADDTLLCHDGRPLVDEVPYMQNQNFRAPYCRKPDAGKLPLVPRDFDVDGPAGGIRLQPRRAALAPIDEEVLWRCHPALAQPGAGYTYLELPEGEQLCQRTRKRKHPADVPLTTQNRARVLEGALAPAAAVHLPPDAQPDTVRTLADEEAEAVVTALRAHLGPEVKLDHASWFISDRNHGPTVAGMCASKSATCVSRSQAGAPHVHHSTRMAFRLLPIGMAVVRCFCDTRHHRLPLDMTPALQQLLTLPRPPPPQDADVAMPPAADVAAAEAAKAAQRARNRFLLDFIRQSMAALAHSPRHVLPDRRRTKDARDQKLFEEVMRGVRDPDELETRLQQYRQRARDMRGEPAWSGEDTIERTHLDLAQDDLLERLLRHPHLVLQSGMGTNKTGAILAFLLILVQLRPDVRILMVSNRITFAETLCKRARELDEALGAALGQALGFRSYTEDEFKTHSAGQYDGTLQQRQQKDKADAALRQTPRLIMSPQSMSRLFEGSHPGARKPHYDIVIVDELMEVLQIFHSSTMNGKRRSGLEQLTHLMTTASRVIAMDAEVDNAMALPLLGYLSGGALFRKLTNTAQTLLRTYHSYTAYGLWRLALLRVLRAGRKVFLASNSKKEVLSILNDPLIRALGLRIVGVHADSSKDDRTKYILSVDLWSTTDLFLISPVISHGVDCSEPHFDVLFIFGTDMATMPCQLFQQALRVRQISTNEVHMYLKTHEPRHAHLSCDFATLRQDLDQRLCGHERDFLVRKGFGQVAHYNFDRSRSEEEGRRVLSSLPNDLYLHCERRINHGKCHFREEMDRLIQATGGRVIVYQTSLEELKEAGAMAKQIQERDRLRDRDALLAIDSAADIDEVQFQELVHRESRHTITPSEVAALRKARAKRTYNIALTDTKRVPSIPNFAIRFATDMSLRQAEAMKRVAMVPAASLCPTMDVGTDPIPYRRADFEQREALDLTLESVGLSALATDEDEPRSALGADTIVHATQQADKLAPGSDLRARVLRGLERASLPHQAWWKKLKRARQWAIRDADGDLCNAAGTLVTGAKVHRALLRHTREYVSAQFGVKVASMRLGRDEDRAIQYRLDRTRWNEFSEPLFGLPPQVLPPEWQAPVQKATAKRKAKSAQTTVPPAPKAKTVKRAAGRQRVVTRRVATKKVGTKKPQRKDLATFWAEIGAAAAARAAQPPTHAVSAASSPVTEEELQWVAWIEQGEVEAELHRQQLAAIGGPEELRELRLLQQQGRHEDAAAYQAAMEVGMA